MLFSRNCIGLLLAIFGDFYTWLQNHSLSSSCSLILLLIICELCSPISVYMNIKSIRDYTMKYVYFEETNAMEVKTSNITLFNTTAQIEGHHDEERDSFIKGQ